MTLVALGVGEIAVSPLVVIVPVVNRQILGNS